MISDADLDEMEREATAPWPDLEEGFDMHDLLEHTQEQIVRLVAEVRSLRRYAEQHWKR